ncbi:RAD55 family ATPase [Salinirubellus salinus]|uniref:RAD55 family ATPase n=1 Tax=Salinirubellus salinus TaxID=1364945 RepID=A0A9E7R1H4_9EURY|nr:RAD55 family ATPase [Salinirubellus salinus]UWM53529.1 RAD55 family ATPase [Salinirubellus salinus]
MSEDLADGSADDPPEDPPAYCDFCRMPIPTDPVRAAAAVVDGDGDTDTDEYVFCSEACRDALADAEFAFTEYHGHRRVRPGVSAFDASLPQGFPRNAFVLMSGEAGTRDRAVQAELVWRTLQRGEPVVIVSLQEPPGSVVQQFLTLEWNVLPYLERGQLHIVDAFTYRLSDRDRMFDRMDEWNKHLYDVARDATTTVRDPSDLGELHNKVDNAMRARDMVDDGLVLVDSLTELGTLVQPVRAYNFVKDLRADVCKGRFVPIFAGATLSGARDEFPHDLEYVVDGIVEMRLNQEIIADTLIKQARIRKLNGVLVIPEWHAYEYTSGTGMVLFDPEEEQEKTRKRREAEAAADAEEGEDGDGDPDEEGETADTDADAATADPATNGDGTDSPADADDPNEDARPAEAADTTASGRDEA